MQLRMSMHVASALATSSWWASKAFSCSLWYDAVTRKLCRLHDMRSMPWATSRNPVTGGDSGSSET
jgi:hypothetical protein